MAATITLIAAASVAGIDARSYFDAGLDDPYRVTRIGLPGYVYSPAFTQAIEPLRWLGWEGFRFVWIFAAMGALVYLVGPWLAVLLVVGGFPPLIWELSVANVNLLLGAAIWAGFRYPALWALPLLIKAPLGVGLIWFVVRKEWRQLAVAGAVTVSVAAVSFVLAPRLWVDYAASAFANVAAAGDYPVIPWAIRLPLAIGLVWWGALRSQHWTVAMAAILTHPIASLSGWVIALGFVRHYFLRRGANIPDPQRP